MFIENKYQLKFIFFSCLRFLFCFVFCYCFLFLFVFEVNKREWIGPTTVILLITSIMMSTIVWILTLSLCTHIIYFGTSIHAHTPTHSTPPHPHTHTPTPAHTRYNSPLPLPPQTPPRPHPHTHATSNSRNQADWWYTLYAMHKAHTSPAIYRRRMQPFTNNDPK